MKQQNLYNIIFSNSRSFRWKRHTLFWLAVFLYHFVRMGIMMPTIYNWQPFLSLVSASLNWGVLPNMFLAYSVAYYAVPKYFNRQKYIAFALNVALFMFILVFYTFLHNYFALNPYVKNAVGIPGNITLNKFRPAMIRIFGNPPLICCLFLSLKTLKNWHLEQLKTETLAKENANAELQLLKAQVHPHFLFNTLNNIYSFSLKQSPQAGTLVRRLSDMLNYMIHECEQPLVSLPREIKLIEDYMGLEKVRYDNRLEMQVMIEGDYADKLIAPLLLIPFVENSFKHGASMMRGQQWIHLKLCVKEDLLYFDLSNSKPSLVAAGTNGKKGIGLVNVQKRLELLYPQKHLLNITSTDAVYSVQLQVYLQLMASETFHVPILKLQPA